MRGTLVTADGATFRGTSVGAAGVATGELVFNTAMTGYQEVLTDPSYAGQVVVMTSSHIGNYGVNDYDDQSAVPAASGLVVRSLSNRHSNWRAEGSFASLLHRHELVALSEIDTAPADPPRPRTWGDAGGDRRRRRRVRARQNRRDCSSHGRTGARHQSVDATSPIRLWLPPSGSARSWRSTSG